MKPETRRAARAARQARERAKRRKRFEHFLRLLVEGARTRTALRKTGLDWRTDIARWFSPVPLYAKRIREAQAAGHEWRRMLLEDELFQRGVVGVPETVWSCGRPVCERIAYSDKLLIALFRRYHPDLFKGKLAADFQTGRSVKKLVRELESGMTSQGHS